MAEEEIITKAIDFLEKIRSEDIVTIQFRKKSDNSVRTMRCTLNFDRIPEPDKPRGINLPKILKLLNRHNIIHVYDLDRMGWRSVPFDRSEWIETPEQRFRIKA